MAAGSGFKHITFSPEPEEDEVIYAGMRRDDGKPDDRDDPRADPDPSLSSDPVSADGDAGKPAVHADDQQDAADDLGGDPMPFVQRIVIAAAVVCLIGAVAYYLIFMR